MFVKNKIEARFTRSYDFLFPILGKEVKLRSLSDYNNKPCLGVFNVYYKSNLLVQNGQEDTNYYLYVVIKKDHYCNWENELLKRLVKTFPIQENILILIFDIIDYQKDIDLFEKGKYSQFSNSLKEHIIGQFPVREIAEESRIFRVLFPNKLHKKRVADWLGCPEELITEISSAPDPVEETLIVKQ
jgi:hypothetical protein